MASPRPLETLLWLLPAKDYQRFYHWLHVISNTGKPPANLLKLLTALKPHLKGDGYVIPVKAWEKMAIDLYGNLKNPNGELYKQRTALLHALLKYFDMLDRQEESHHAYIGTLSWSAGHRHLASFKVVRNRLKDKLPSVLTDSERATAFTLTDLEIQFDMAHPSALDTSRAEKRKLFRHQWMETVYLKTYRMALVLKSREQLEAEHPMVVQFLDTGWTSDEPISQDLILTQEAYYLVMGDDPGFFNPERVNQFYHNVLEHKDNVSSYTFSMLNATAFNLYVRILRNERHESYYQILAEMLWKFWLKDSTVIHKTTIRNAISISSIMAMISQGTDQQEAWLHRSQVFLQHSKSLIPAKDFDSLFCITQCLNAFVREEYQVCLDCPHPSDPDSMSQIPFRMVQLQALYELPPNKRGTHYDLLNAQLRHYFKAKEGQIPAEQMQMFKAQKTYINSLFNSYRSDQKAALRADFEKEKMRFSPAFRIWFSKKLS